MFNRLSKWSKLATVCAIVIAIISIVAIIIPSAASMYNNTNCESRIYKAGISSSLSDFSISVKHVGNIVIIPSEFLLKQGIENKLVKYYLEGRVILILGPNIDLSHVRKFIDMLTIKLIQESYRLSPCTIALAIFNAKGKTAIAEYGTVNILSRRCVVLSREYIERYLLKYILNDTRAFVKRVLRDLGAQSRSITYFEIEKQKGGRVIGFRKIAWYYIDPCGHPLGYGHLYVKLYYVATDKSTGKSLFVVYAESLITDYNKNYECDGYVYGSVMFKNITIVRDALAEKYPYQYVGASGPTEQADCPSGTLAYSFTISETPGFTITIGHKYGGSSDYAVALKWVVSTLTHREAVVNEFVACKPEKYQGRTGYGDTLVEMIGYEPVHAKVWVEQWILVEVRPSWWPWYFEVEKGPFKTTCKLEMYSDKAIVKCNLS